MRHLLTFAAAVVVSCGACAAPATSESIETLFVAARVEASMEFVLGNMEQIMQNSIRQSFQGPPPIGEQQRFLDSMVPKVSALIRSEMSWERLKPIYVQVYRETFDQEEVDGLTAFYSSPVGQAYAKKQPALTLRTLGLAQSVMGSVRPQIKALVESAMAEARLQK